LNKLKVAIFSWVFAIEAISGGSIGLIAFYLCVVFMSDEINSTNEGIIPQPCYLPSFIYYSFY